MQTRSALATCGTGAPVEEPVGDFERPRVADDDHELLQLLRRQLAGPAPACKAG